MKSTEPLDLFAELKSRKQDKKNTVTMVEYGQMIPGITQDSMHTEWGVQPTALRDFTMAVPKFGQVVNCHFDDVKSFLSSKSILTVYIHCILLSTASGNSAHPY